MTHDDDDSIISTDDSSLSYSYSFPSIIGSGTIGIPSIGSSTFPIPTANIISASEGVSASTILMKSVSKRIMKMQAAQNDVVVHFYGTSGDAVLSARLSPESNITPIESMRINLLLLGAQHGVDFEPIEYIKSNNLERHFVFSVDND